EWLARQGMRWRNQGYVLVGEERHRRDLCVPRRLRYQGEIDLSGSQHPQRLAAGLERDLELRVHLAIPERLDGFGHPVIAGVTIGPDANDPTRRFTRLRQLGLRRVEALEHGARMSQHLRAERRG